MKKLLALVIVGSMLVAMPVMAAPSPSAAAVSAASTSVNVAPAQAVGAVIKDSTGDAVTFTKEMAAEATSANLSAVEYVNNIVATVPGLETALPIAQGGHVVINGAPVAAKLNLAKPTKAEATAAKTYAASAGGTAIGLIGIKPSFQFETLQTSLAVAGIKAADAKNIVAFQIIDGKLVPVKINGIKDNFIDVTLKGVGQLLIVQK